MTTDATWLALERVCRGMQGAAIADTWTAQFPVLTAEDLAAVQRCVEESVHTGLEAKPPTGHAELLVGHVADISFLPRTGYAVVAKNMDAYLIVPQCRIKAKKRFFLVDVGAASTDVQPHQDVQKYLLVLKLVQSLKDAAAYLDEEEQSLVFISDGRFDLPVRYTSEDLRNLDGATVEALTTLVPTDTHKKQCASILATAVVDLVRAQPPEARFAHLLANAKALRTAYEEGYKLYAAGFSYDKVKDTVETARVEYVAKIHKVFSDIQNQLLGIPVATIVVATQMKSAAPATTEFFINTAVVVGCWVFVIITLLLLRNQKHTLKVVTDEIARQKKVLERDYPSISKTFIEPFEFLTKRARAQAKVLWAMDAVVAVGLVLSHVVYFYLTPSAWVWVKSFF